MPAQTVLLRADITVRILQAVSGPASAAPSACDEL
jgi:hypothetical protein